MRFWRTSTLPSAAAIVLAAALLVAPLRSAGAAPQGQPATANEIFITQLYQLMLQRPPTAAELAARLQSLTRGVSRTTVVGKVLGGSEFFTLLVQGVYQQLLGRSPRAGELAAGVRLLKRGGRLEQVAQTILASAEYFLRSGGTATRYLDALYRELLGRPPGPADAAQLRVFNALLARGNRGGVVALLLQNAAAKQQLITAQFQRLLGRTPTASELAFWQRQFGRGQGVFDLMVALLGTDQFLAQVAPDAAAAWVQLLFQQLLNRPATDQEVVDILAALAQGDTFGATASQLLASDEFFAALAQAEFQRLLGRPPTPDELQQWTTSLAAGVTPERLEARLIASPEFFAASGGTNAAFARAMFPLVLFRDLGPSDAARLQQSVNLLDAGIAPLIVTQQLQDSVIGRQALVTDLFEQFLNRSPSLAELATWTRFLGGSANGANLPSSLDLVAAIAGSNEFFNLPQP